MRRRILSLAMSVVLAFSMVSATALTAFADQLGAASLGAQTASGSLVYDDVYGVFGGEYALMYKDVISDTGYTTGQTVSDVVKSDGTVTVHTSNISDADGENPGGWADLQLSTALNAANYIQYGFVRVKSKSTGKEGIKKLDGTELVPCSYDAVCRIDSGDLAAVSYGTATAQVTFFDAAGNQEGTFTADAASGGGTGSSVSVRGGGTYARVNGGVYETNSGQYHAFNLFVKKTGSSYAKTSEVTEVFGGTSTETLYAKSDGNVYYLPNGGSEVKLLLTSDSSHHFFVHHGEVSSKGISLNGDDSWSDSSGSHSTFVQKYFDKSGNEITSEEYNGASSASMWSKYLDEDYTTQYMVDESGNLIVRNGYSLAVDRSSGRVGSWNSLRHGTLDVWWAKSSTGKWGAIDSNGNVKVPFDYDGYFDAGRADTNLALVRQNGLWSFVDVSNGDPIDSATGGNGDSVDSATSGGKDISKATITGIPAQTYTGSALTPAATVTYQGTTLVSGVDYVLDYANNVNAGTASVVAYGCGNYSGQLSSTFTIGKAANPMKVKAKTKVKKLKAKSLAKKAKKFTALKFTKKAAGKVTYKSASPKKVAKKFTVNKKTGKVTAKKGTKAGTYKVKIKIKAAGDMNRKSASKTVTIKVKVK